MAKRGRPRLSDYPSERLDVRVPQPLYDALCSTAVREQKSLCEVVREALLVRILPVNNRQIPSLP